MRYRLLLSAGLAGLAADLAATPLAAQAIAESAGKASSKSIARSVVSAGEHGGYSRMVFDHQGKDVTVVQSGRTVRLNNLQADAAFDFRNINARRKAHRVLNAKTVASGVELQLTCDCSVRTSTLSNGRFVVDVVEGRAAQTEGRTAAETAASPPQTPAQNSAAANVSGEAGQSTDAKDLLSKEDLISVEQAHTQMVELLKQAAREGLITIRDEKAGAQPAPAQNNAEPRAAAREAAAPTVLTPPAVEKRAEAESGAASENKSQPATTATAPPSASEPTTVAEDAKTLCRSDARFAVNADGFDDEPLAQIAALQAALGEDRNDREALHALAEGFISIGFGEEAVALLVDHDQGWSLHADMARVIAERPVSPQGALMGARGCMGAHALWQAAASDPAEAVALYERSDGAVAMLPPLLKRLMATRLAAKMIDAEAWNHAAALFAIASDGLEALSPELDYIRARLDQNGGEMKQSRDTLLDIASHNSNAADDALLALADSYADGDLQPHDGFAEDIGALARVQGSSRAAIAEAQSWAGLGNVDAALMLLQSVSRKTPDERAAAGAVATTIIGDALASEDNILKISGLDGYVAHRDWLGEDKPAQTLRLSAARAATDFALPNLAYSLLDEAPPPISKRVSLEKAAAALAAGYADEAIAIAAPYAEEDTFAEIIIDANIAKGQHSAALAAASTLTDPARKAGLSARAAWLARSWQSAVRGYQALDPNQLTGRSALNYALSAYMSGQRRFPAAAEAALSSQNDTVATGLRALFAAPEPQSSTLQRGRREVENTAREIRFFEEVLSDG